MASPKLYFKIDKYHGIPMNPLIHNLVPLKSPGIPRNMFADDSTTFEGPPFDAKIKQFSSSLLSSCWIAFGKGW